MSLPEYFEVSKVWDDYPPLHMAFLAANGHKPKKVEQGKLEAKKADPRQMEELLAMFGATPGMLVLDKPPT